MWGQIPPNALFWLCYWTWPPQSITYSINIWSYRVQWKKISSKKTTKNLLMLLLLWEIHIECISAGFQYRLGNAAKKARNRFEEKMSQLKSDWILPKRVLRREKSFPFQAQLCSLVVFPCFVSIKTKIINSLGCIYICMYKLCIYTYIINTCQNYSIFVLIDTKQGKTTKEQSWSWNQNWSQNSLCQYSIWCLERLLIEKLYRVKYIIIMH